MPVRVLVTVWFDLSVKVTLMDAPISPLTVMTPLAWMDSLAVAPPLTPVPSAKTGTPGGTAVTSACSSARVSTPEPLSSDPAIAVRTASRLEKFTSLMPRLVSFSSSRGDAPPAATLMTAFAASASFCSTVTVSTSDLVLLTSTSSSSEALAVPMPVTPTRPYCAAVAFALLPPVPAKMAE